MWFENSVFMWAHHLFVWRISSGSQMLFCGKKKKEKKREVTAVFCHKEGSHIFPSDMFGLNLCLTRFWIYFTVFSVILAVPSVDIDVTVWFWQDENCVKHVKFSNCRQVCSHKTPELCRVLFKFFANASWKKLWLVRFSGKCLVGVFLELYDTLLSCFLLLILVWSQ